MVSLLLAGPDARMMWRFRRPLLEAALRHGHRVAAATDTTHAPSAANLRALGIDVHHVPLPRASLNPLHAFAARRAFDAALAEVRPDTVLAYTAQVITLALPAARAAGVPRRAAMLSGLGYGFAPEADLRERLVGILKKRLLARSLLRDAQVVIFHNPDDRDLISRLLGGRHSDLQVVHGSGVDTVEFAPAGPYPEHPTFVFVGRLLRSKGVLDFLAAAQVVRRAYPSARFIVVGGPDANPDGVSGDELWQLAGAAGAELVGHQEDPRPFVAQGWAVVLPSRSREGLPRVLLEGMAMGRAVVGTDVPGVREVVRHEETGLLVPPGDVPALAAALTRLAADRGFAEQCGARGRALAERDFEASRVADRTLGLATGSITGTTTGSSAADASLRFPAERRRAQS